MELSLTELFGGRDFVLVQLFFFVFHLTCLLTSLADGMQLNEKGLHPVTPKVSQALVATSEQQPSHTSFEVIRK
ncbi:hypothetical protein GCM10011418_19030 [Sphingobacterium alkalisoli]|nr:hypothetical protein GCM10011418_19030 [Sphingobacterium alkalisoli]